MATSPTSSMALPLEGGPWRLAFDLWAPAEASRWRAVVARSATDALCVLADHDVDALLRQRMERQWQRPVRWLRCDSAAVDGWLGEGEAGFRALDLVDAGASAGGPVGAGSGETHELSVRHLAEQASPVLRLLDSTLYDALSDGASDLHFECTARGLSIRCRIDGVMQPVRDVDGVQLAEQLVSRLKVMAELDIGERRVPQDGRFQLKVQSRKIDFRLSVIPSVFGEDAVVRVLDRSTLDGSGGADAPAPGTLTLESLGFDDALRATIRTLARAPHGMLLVTGPTGSGKTTTLYAAITEGNTGPEKTITIEDPVEYQLPGVVQIPVNEKTGLSFARGLRSVLRHDPDRVMVGEIRDAETAQIAVQAALTGHLVFSSVHANNAFDVIARFMHMGLDLYSVVSALNGVLAQRLLRVNCPRCSTPVTPPSDMLDRLGLSHRAPALESARIARGTGCEHCRGTGYRGRQAVAEVLLMDDALRDLIAAREPMGRIKEAARERGMRSLREAALDLVLCGRSTFEELDRVTLAD